MSGENAMIKLKVTEQGVMLPKQYFPDVSEVEIYLTQDGVLVKKPKISEESRTWSENFLNFQGIEDSIDFADYRQELLEPKQEIFE